MQVNRTNHDFLAQSFKELHHNFGKYFSNLSAHCLDPMFTSICSGLSCSHKSTSPNKSGSFIYRVRGPGAPVGPIITLQQPEIPIISPAWFQTFFQIAVAKSLLKYHFSFQVSLTKSEVPLPFFFDVVKFQIVAGDKVL